LKLWRMKKDAFPDTGSTPPKEESVGSSVSRTAFLVVFTDLDGTLLDHVTYSWEEAEPALDLCKRLSVPVILASSKTRAEVEVIRSSLSITDPFITENGGGIFSPDETPGARDRAHGDNVIRKWSVGLPYARLVKGLRQIRDELGWKIRGFSDMSIDEISDLTGLDEEASRLAAKREFDEPFIVVNQEYVDSEKLLKAAARRGFTIVEGGRFFHLTGNNHKGQAMEKIMSWYGKYHKEVVSAALGDGPNDFSMLELADHPILVRSGRSFPGLKDRIPRLRITTEMGPKGWNRAVLEILRRKREAGNV